MDAQLKGFTNKYIFSLFIEYNKFHMRKKLRKGSFYLVRLFLNIRKKTENNLINNSGN